MIQLPPHAIKGSSLYIIVSTIFCVISIVEDIKPDSIMLIFVLMLIINLWDLSKSFHSRGSFTLRNR